MASFIELAGNLRIRVVAEGIGTQEQLCFLCSVGCDMVLGLIYSPYRYKISRPGGAVRRERFMWVK